jgi:hypothetical protein
VNAYKIQKRFLLCILLGLGLVWLSILPVRAADFEIVKPEYIVFTPNHDSTNNTFRIFFRNPADCEIAGHVYDILGRYVADMTQGMEAGADPPYYMEWDGCDKNGKDAPIGIYIYHIEAGTQKFSGVMVIAR